MILSKTSDLIRRTSWSQRAMSVIGGLLVLRIAYAAVVPIDLVHDEAYYWDWSRRLDWCYYSKPPMVAWLVAASTQLFGPSTLAVRLPAVLLGTGGLVLVYLLASQLYDARTGFWAVLLSALCPGNAALSLMMTIDAPLLFFWCGGLLFFWNLVEQEPNRHPLVWVILASVSVGCGLLSKQTMVGFLALSAVFLLLSRKDRRLLKSWRYLAFVVGSLSFLLPVIWWNYQHQWITLQHTGGHFQREPATLLRHVAYLSEFIAVQFVVVSPITCALLFIVAACSVRWHHQLARPELFLLTFSLLPLAAVYLLALKQRVEPNWPAPFYVSGIILLAAWLQRSTALGNVFGRRQMWSRRACMTGAGTMLVAYLLPFGWGLEGSKFDPVVRLRGWRQLGAAVGEEMDKLPDEPSFVWVVGGRAMASELAFYVPRQPRVFLWDGMPGITSQYDLWGDPQEEDGRHALIVTGPHGPPPAVSQRFDSVRPLTEVDVPVGHGRSRHCFLWHGARLRKEPSLGREVVETPDAQERMFR